MTYKITYKAAGATCTFWKELSTKEEAEEQIKQFRKRGWRRLKVVPIETQQGE